MFEDIIKKAKFLIGQLDEIEKDFAFSGEPVNTGTEGYRNYVYGPKSSKKKKKKEKDFLLEAPYLR